MSKRDRDRQRDSDRETEKLLGRVKGVLSGVEFSCCSDGDYSTSREWISWREAALEVEGEGP